LLQGQEQSQQTQRSERSNGSGQAL
jgi:hypothetical protein